MLRVVVALAVLAFTVYTVVDCIQTKDERVRNLPKLVWVVLILLFTPAGGIAWLFAGRPLEREGGPFGRLPFGPQDKLAPRGRSSYGPPMGPDDDPEFLKGL
ncbi:MAG: PLD nuclease N-terminal domain-containing protein [Dermatophilaceae bacterium]